MKKGHFCAEVAQQWQTNHIFTEDRHTLVYFTSRPHLNPSIRCALILQQKLLLPFTPFVSLNTHPLFLCIAIVTFRECGNIKKSMKCFFCKQSKIAHYLFDKRMKDNKELLRF